MSANGLPCYGCAYRDEIPGSAHSRCVFKWERPEDLPIGNPHGVTHGWFIFPFNYDPIWGPDTCVGHSATREPAKVLPSNPLMDLISILGKRL